MGAPDEILQSVGRLHIGRASGSIGQGKYRVFASLGRGGMADVLLGAAQGPKGFNKLVVVKRLRGLLADDPSIVNMFLDEARLAARLSHPNVIHTYEVGEEQGNYFIVMEYLDGQPLHEILHALKLSEIPVAPIVWAKMIADALAGLHHAHELCDYDGTILNVVHRDVSPQNIIVTYDGRVKLVDFGIAKASVNTTKTESGIIKGKLAYMAPEQAEPDDGIDRRADIFAMGIVLWECLTLKRLITGDAASAMTKIVDMEFKAPSLINPAVPKELDAITLKALERDPDKRFQTAQEMRDALEAFIRASGSYVRDDEIGKLLVSMFSSQREEVRGQIREYMANLSSGKNIVVSASDETMPGATPIVTGPSSPPRLVITESSRSVRAVQSNATRLPESRGSRRARLAMAIGGTVLVIVAIVSIRQRVARPPTPPLSSAGMSGISSAAPMPERPSVRLRIQASPSDATLVLDDAELPSNPFTGSFAKDSLEHRVRASRPGYVTETKLVRFDEDVMIDLSLAKAEVEAGGGTAKPVKPGPANPQTPSGRPKLDEDPWR